MSIIGVMLSGVSRESVTVDAWVFVVALGLAVAALWHQIMRNLGKPYPLCTFLFYGPAKYSDLTNTWVEAQNPQPCGAGASTPYFPLVFWWLKCLSREKLVIVYQLTYAALALALIALWPMHWGYSLVLLCSYPALFANDRGNIDHIVGAISAIGITLLFRGQPYCGAIALGVAVAAKGYPAPLMLLWLLQRQHVATAVGIATAVLLVILPARTFKGGLFPALRGWRSGVSGYSTMAAVASRGPMYSTNHYSFDLFQGLRSIAWWLGKPFDSARLLRPYLVLSTLWSLTLVARAVTAHDPWIAVLALALVSCIWPSVANDYRLCMLFAAIPTWLAAGAPNQLVFWCLALLMVPKHYWFPRPGYTWASISCVVSPLLVIGISIGVWLR